MVRRLLLCLCAFSTLGGCASAGMYQARTHVSKHGLTTLTYPENHRFAFVKRNDNVEHFCSGPGIDVASSSRSGFSFGSGQMAAGGEGMEDTRENAEISLGGRDAAVLITREILFRTCETILNNELDSEAALQLYSRSLDVILAITQQANLDSGSAAGTSSEDWQE